MKKKLLTAVVVAVAAFSFTACQEDATLDEMDQMIQDTEMTTDPKDTGSGNGSQGGGDGVG